MIQESSRQNETTANEHFENYNAVEWWKYAGHAILKDIRTRKGQYTFKLLIL